MTDHFGQANSSQTQINGYVIGCNSNKETSKEKSAILEKGCQ